MPRMLQVDRILPSVPNGLFALIRLAISPCPSFLHVSKLKHLQAGFSVEVWNNAFARLRFVFYAIRAPLGNPYPLSWCLVGGLCFAL